MGRKVNMGTGINLLFLLASGCILTGSSVIAQSPTGDYKVGEKKADNSDNDLSRSSTPQQRAARIDYVNGNVTWRAREKDKWSKAGSNVPVREGAQIWVTDGGHAEVRFDDGSLLRLGNNSVVTLKHIFRDDDGEFTQINMISGLATLMPKQKQSLFEVDTPLVSLHATGPAHVRIGVGDDIEVAVRSGSVNVEGKLGKTTVRSGDYLSIDHNTTAYALKDLPAPDSWERWNDDCDDKLAGIDHSNRSGPWPVYVPGPVYVPEPSYWFSFDFGRPYYGYHGWRGGGFHGHRW